MYHGAARGAQLCVARGIVAAPDVYMLTHMCALHPHTGQSAPNVPLFRERERRAILIRKANS
jgi:hypothetical protein